MKRARCREGTLPKLLAAKAIAILTCLSACASAAPYAALSTSGPPPLSPWTSEAIDNGTPALEDGSTLCPSSRHKARSHVAANNWLCRQRRLVRRDGEQAGLCPRQQVASILRRGRDALSASRVEGCLTAGPSSRCALTNISRGGSSYGGGGGGAGGGGGGSGYGDDMYDDGYGGYDGYDDRGGGGQYGDGYGSPYGQGDGGSGGGGSSGRGGKRRSTGKAGEQYFEEDYYEEEYYDSRGAPPRKTKRTTTTRTSVKKRKAGGGLVIGGIDVTGTITTGNKKFGIIAIACSFALTMLGISLFFNKTLMRLGNICFVAGCSLFIGPSRTIRYFAQTSKLRGTIIFMLGFLLVFTGHPIIGLVLEVFGFLNLFGNMLPMVGSMARNMPFVKDILGSTSGRGSGGGGKRRPARQAPPRQYPPPDYDDDYRYR